VWQVLQIGENYYKINNSKEENHKENHIANYSSFGISANSLCYAI